MTNMCYLFLKFIDATSELCLLRPESPSQCQVILYYLCALHLLIQWTPCSLILIENTMIKLGFLMDGSNSSVPLMWPVCLSHSMDESRWPPTLSSTLSSTQARKWRVGLLDQAPAGSRDWSRDPGLFWIPIPIPENICQNRDQDQNRDLPFTTYLVKHVHISAIHGISVKMFSHFSYLWPFVIIFGNVW